MRKKEQMFWLASRSRMWRIPLCMAAFSLLPSAYSFASAENPATETVLAVNSVQQQRTVKGIVIDANGEAVIGANVKEPGSTTGTITDMNGEFSLSVGPKATLEISFIGYTTQKVNVGASNTVKVILKEDTKVLDEVVITGFGMSQKKATLTGAVAAIASTDIERSNATTASGALVGKIAGINTRQNDGRPGASTQLQIRNMGAPLYVIDGVVSDDGQFNHMDFNDIESISILKDASAAIYGVRAANGVVVVTSKKGQRNSKNSVSINAYYGWQHNSRYVQPAKTKDYVNAYVSAETWAKKADNDRRYNKEEYAKWMAGTEKNYQGFDWSDYIWITAPQSYISANLSGGTDKANYYVAVSHIDQEATVRGYGGFRRTNAQMNIDMNISDRFKIGATMNGRIEDRHHPGVPGGDDTWLPRFATMKNQPTKRPYANDNPLYPQLVSDQKETNFALLNYDTSGKVSDVWRVIQMQTTAEYEILKGLKAKAKMSYDFRNYKNKNFNPKDPYTYEPTESGEIVKAEVGSTVGKLNQEMGNNITKDMQFSLNYTRTFGKHDISAMAMYQATNPSYEWMTGFREFMINSLPVLNAGNDLKQNNGGTEGSSLVMALIGRVNYAYANKYMIEGVLRYDGSSTFAPDKRWSTFPSVSIGWRISEESFFKENISFISNFKLRASYGVVGDQGGFSPFQYLEGYYYPSGKYLFTENVTTIGLSSSGIANPDLTWFESKIANIGFELSILNGLFTAEFDMFRRDRSGLMARRNFTLPTSFGTELPEENLNSDMTRGFELVLGHNNTIGDFTYGVKSNATITRSRNKYVERAPDSNKYTNWRNNSNDRNKDLTWGYTMIGQFRDYEEILNSPVQDSNGNKSLLPGDFKYKDLNGDNIIDDNDVSVIGLGNTPFIYFGLNLTAAWKGFDVNVLFQGAGGHKIQLGSAFYQSFMNEGNSNGMAIWIERSHRVDSKDPASEWIIGKLPPVRKAGFANNEKVNSYYLLDADYLRLKNLEIGYTVPKGLTSKIGVDKIRVFFNGSNLLTFTKGWLMKNIDPENNNSNAWYYPQAKMYNFGLSLSF